MMNKLMIALALSGASLSACTANQVLQGAPIIGSICTAAEGTLIDEKAVLSAEVLYNAPAQAYVAANDAGLLSVSQKALIKPKLIQLYSLLQTVKAAKGTVNCSFAAMQQLHADVVALLPAKGK